MRAFVRRQRRRLIKFWASGSGVKAAILATCLLSTASAFLAGSRAQDRLDEAVASEVATQLASDIEQSIKSYETLLRSVSYIASVVPELDEFGFKKYVRNFDLEKEYPGLFGLGWSVKQEPTDAGNDIHEILFIEPMNDRNASAIGFNMFSDPVRRKAMLAASEAGTITASDPVKLVQETATNQQAGILVYAPVYNGDAVNGYANLRGFIYGIIRVEDMLKTVLPTKLRKNTTFALYSTPQPSAAPVFETTGFSSSPHSDLMTTSVAIPGKTWTLAIDPKTVNSQNGFIPFRYYTLAGGLVLTAVIYLLTASVYSRRAEIQQSLSAAREQNRIRSVLVKELNHRVKNSLATVLSLASLARRHADDIDSFYEGFSARVAALAGTHDILTRSDWHDASIHEIITAELGAHTSQGGGRLTLDGPDLELKPSAALTLGLAIHELATNAAKYGALSTPEGSIDIQWELEGTGRDALVDFRWTEHGGPSVEPPTSEGFGTTLLTRLTARELGGVVEIDFAPAGLRARITLLWSKTQAADVSADFKD